MDNTSCDSSDKESSERRNSNSEWLPTKCRITKPPPPKPATNPLQFVKVTPSALFQKAHEQIKKVEEIKTQKPKEDAEEWQQNLDNWKSSRRKRQEHIIERVVEVKKLEQEGYDRSRRKSKTFNEIMEDRNKRGHRMNIPIFDDDSNDLSDYGIGSSSSKANSVKDVDTDDSSSCLDDKDAGISTSGSQSGKDASSASNQSQSEDELLSSTNFLIDKDNNPKTNIYNNKNDNNPSNIYINKQTNHQTAVKSTIEKPVKNEEYKDEDYTYQRAIEDYRSKILPKLTESETTFTVKFDRNSSYKPPKVDLCSSKQVFETKKPIEVTHLDLNLSKRLSEDFANSLSIKERLKNLEKCADLQIKSIEKNTQGHSVKSIIKSLTKRADNDIKNNNFDVSKNCESTVPKTENINEFLVDNFSNEEKNEVFHRSASPEVDAYMQKLNQFNQDLDTFLIKSHSPQSSVSDCFTTPLVSSTDLIGISSDREDSGIHTADVSCSVSQADDSVEYNDILSSTIPNCIEKLQKERERELTQQVESKLNLRLRETQDVTNKVEETDQGISYEILKQSTQAFLDNVRQKLNEDFEAQMIKSNALVNVNKEDVGEKFSLQQESHLHSNKPDCNSKPVIYENVELKNYSGFFEDPLITSSFPLAPPKTKEPPKEKPPPPPPPDAEDKPKETNIKRLNSTKRIKKEIHIKRSSFLGLDEPTDDMLDPIMPIDTPPDIHTFLQKESQLEKSLYRKYQDSRETCSSEVESQDSGLESERGRLSSDTWCSSLGESNSTHDRQDSEQTINSVTSEEDEIAKKEQEIIALVEKEEKSKDVDQFSNSMATGVIYCNMIHNNTTNEKFKIPYFPKNNSNYNILGPEEDSEVLRVEQELLQLEKEEMERQKENMLFRENKDKLLRKNRYSLENICDTPDGFSGYYEDVNCRKSMPDLPNDVHARNYQKHQNMNSSTPHYYKPTSGIDTRYRKSMPDIQQAYLRSVDINDTHNEIRFSSEHRKSMPELQQTAILAGPHYTSFNRQPVMPGKPLTSLIKEQRDRAKLLMTNSVNDAENPQYQNIKPGIPITRPGINALSAVPKHRNIPNDNWIQPKINANNKPKNYSKHWLYQEAELRRLAEQKTTPRWNYQQVTQEKHIPEPIIETLTQRVQKNLTISDRNNHYQRRSENNQSQEITQHPPYMNRPHTVGHASPVTYPPLPIIENPEGKILSVSGKKKCSFCGNELGRGAAMIIESLCLFYHMDCFKCCVCHIQLGDGLMGTDVRVRNQKLHCHNCYTSDDGVKFSCV